jgi:hypothetical protein
VFCVSFSLLNLEWSISSSSCIVFPTSIFVCILMYYSVYNRFFDGVSGELAPPPNVYPAMWGWKGTPHPSILSTHFGLYGPNFSSSDSFICDPVFLSVMYCAYNTNNVHLLGSNVTGSHRYENTHSRNSPNHDAAPYCPARRD